MKQNTPICLVSGAGGFLGGRVKDYFLKHGWQVRELTRRPIPGSAAIRFQLGDTIAPEALAGAQALVHCAYDFNLISWKQIQAINVRGAEELMNAANAAGIPRIVCISSISAFEGCRSLYGQAKLEIEQRARQRGAFLLRPGLIFGEPPGAMFGRLVDQVKKAGVIPLVGGGQQIQYLVHEEDLCRFILRCAEGQVPPSLEPVTVAHERGWTFRQILEEIARAQGKRLRFVAMPWRAVWAGMKLVELAGLRLGFRSDSLLSLMYQNPRPAFELLQRLNVQCRPFQ
jgi:nucleoside-diphosphate-sugar epimerase